ncbi:tRNA-splicing endonuclease subunit sen54 N-term-domain-containing protein [Flammula alnicola]|nr:tRNA-splicing endonuclease subunit sen54 N-term-domain-containing protein [Flammula alnicola]
MDDSLETPSALLPKAPLSNLPPEDDEDQSSEEEDGGLDWTKLLPASARPVIPRRGEKEFEPRAGGGTNLQLHVLDRARSAMFETLRATRTISSKAISYATWHPDIARIHVTAARGIHFSSMGHSAPRSVLGEDGTAKIQKRLELLPEEAIYLIERGSLFCWKQTDLNLGQVPGLNDVGGSPMTVQQAFSELIGKEDLTLEKFQVYAYLKRLGYVVTRSNPPDPHYPLPPNLAVVKPSSSIIERIKSIFPAWISSMSRMLFGAFNWWKPVHISRWLHHDKNYSSLFRSLRFMSVRHDVPLKSSDSSPYRIFFNVYKPSTPFKKSAPPAPDFQLVVINGRTTPMPTLQELNNLFAVLPEASLPAPRRRRPPTDIANNQTAAPQTPLTAMEKNPSFDPQPTLICRLLPWFFPSPPPSMPSVLPRRPNPFAVLKAGKKIIIIAVVDASNTSFFRFGQGEFTEWPMM